MSVSRKSGGSMIPVTAIKRKSGGVMVDVAAGWRRQSGAWVQIWPMVVTGLVQISGHDINHADPLPGQARATYSLNANGNIYQDLQGNVLLIEPWLLSGLNSDYQVRATASGDTPNVGTLNTWMTLDVTRSWGFNPADMTPGNDTVLTVEIRRVSDSLLLDSAQISMHVETEEEF